MAMAACRENAETNVRYDGVYLVFRVEVDESAARTEAMSVSTFAAVYEELLSRSDIHSSRVRVDGPNEIRKPKFERRF